MMVRVYEPVTTADIALSRRALSGDAHLTRLPQLSHRPRHGSDEYDSLTDRGVFDKSPNRPASPARRLVIEATYPL